ALKTLPTKQSSQCRVFQHNRPEPACGDFLVDWSVYFVSRHSLNSSRRTEFGASGHCRISTSDVSKIAADRPLSKMRQCANDRKPAGRFPPKQSFDESG